MRVPEINAYDFGRVVVDGEPHERDLIILPDRVLGGWWRKEGHVLHPEDLRAVFESLSEVLVVGQGANGLMQVAPATDRELAASGIELVAEPTDQACETYNRLRKKRPVAAALHLTC
jgi:hypothetical protein